MAKRPLGSADKSGRNMSIEHAVNRTWPVSRREVSRRDLLAGLAAGAVTLTVGRYAKAADCTSTSTRTLQLNIKCDSTLAAKYSGVRGSDFYQPYFDEDTDGVFDGTGTSRWSDRIARIPTDYAGSVALDWEHAYGAGQGFALAIGGYYGVDKQQAAMAEAIKVIKALKAARPKVKAGFYNVPYDGRAYSVARDGTASWWLSQPTALRPLLDLCDIMVPSNYLPYKIVSGAAGSGEVTVAVDQKRSANYMALCQKCGLGKPILPYVQQIYRNSALAINLTDIPPQEIYWQVQGMAESGATGCVLWGSSSKPEAKETSLKAIRQAIDGVSFQA